MENSVIDREHDKVVSKPNHQSEFKYTPPSTEDNNICWSDFLNPRSMLTPGVAGSLIMLIANTLWVQFAVPQKWSALTLSFLLIVPILIKFAASLFENIIYFVFNGLIVFALAVNANFVGEKLQQVSVADHASLNTNTQKINAALKSSLATATSDTNQNIKQTNQMQLASNDDQGISNLSLVSDNERNSDSDSSKQREGKRDNEKRKAEEEKNDRPFFKKWF